MDRIFKSVVDKLKDESPLQRELFRICYERKRARYEEGYSSLVMNRYAWIAQSHQRLRPPHYLNYAYSDWPLTRSAKHLAVSYDSSSQVEHLSMRRHSGIFYFCSICYSFRTAVLSFMNICFCCPVVQGYGLTETCGGASLADGRRSFLHIP